MDINSFDELVRKQNANNEIEMPDYTTGVDGFHERVIETNEVWEVPIVRTPPGFKRYEPERIDPTIGKPTYISQGTSREERRQEDTRKEDTFFSKLGRLVLPESVENWFGIDETDRKPKEPTYAERLREIGKQQTLQMARENPEWVSPQEYFKSGLSFGNNLYPDLDMFDDEIIPSDLPEPVTKAQKRAYMIGTITTMAIAQPFIESAFVGLASKIPGGAQMIQKINAAAKASPWKIGYPMAITKAFGEGSLFGLITENKKSVVQNMLETGLGFAAFTAVLYPVFAFFTPVIKELGSLTIKNSKLKNILNDPAVTSGPISDVMYFRSSKNPNQFLRVTVDGIESVEKNAITAAGETVENVPILTEVEIKMFEKSPSTKLYKKLLDWFNRNKKIKEDFIDGKVVKETPGTEIPKTETPPTEAPVVEVPKTEVTTRPSISEMQKMTKAELIEFAEKTGTLIKKSSTKAMIINQIISNKNLSVEAKPVEETQVIATDDLIAEAQKYDSVEEFIESQRKPPEYGMKDRPREDGTLAYDLPEDIAGTTNTKADKESREAIEKIKNKPDEDIKIYRAASKDELNYGDWVTFSKRYATQQAGGDSPYSKVFEYTVKAKDLRWAMKDVNEFGYFPEQLSKDNLEKIWEEANKTTSENVNIELEDFAIRQESPQELAYYLSRKLQQMDLGDIKLTDEQKMDLQQWDTKWGNTISSVGLTAVKEVPDWVTETWNKTQTVERINATKPDGNDTFEIKPTEKITNEPFDIVPTEKTTEGFIPKEDIAAESVSRQLDIVVEDINAQIQELADQRISNIESPTQAQIDESIKQATKEIKEAIRIQGESIERPKMIINKTQLKDILKSFEEEFITLKAILKDDKKYLYYQKSPGNHILIRPSAMGLVDENIKIGDLVKLDVEKLKPKGRSVRAVDSKTGEVLASKGSVDISKFEQRTSSPKESIAGDFKLFKEVNNIIKKYAERVGERYLPRGTNGVYYHGTTKNIRITNMNQLSVASHEVSHYLDEKFGITDQLMKITGYGKSGNPIYEKGTYKLRKELTKLYLQYYPQAQPYHSLKLRMREGFATLIQKYIERPKTITQNYPNLVKEILTQGGKYYNDVIGEMISDLNKIVADYQGLSDLDKIGAKMTSQKSKTGKESFLNPFKKN
jgi:hypothetical protein